MKHHPNHELLTAFASAELPASLSIAVAAHLELCPKCQARVEALTQHHAEQIFQPFSDDNTAASPFVDSQSANGQFIENQEEYDHLFDELIDDITADDSLIDVAEPEPVQITFKQQVYTLPRALRSLTLQKPQKLGKLTRSRVELQDGQLKTSLLHIEPGGTVPMHTHKGFELTLLLSGEFADEMGHYQPGDFIWLTGEHEHTPSTETGCLCLTVSNDALQFTQGISKLLNPIGQFIY